MKTFFAFVAATFAYAGCKFAMPVIVLAGPDKAQRAEDLQLCWALVGFLLLFGMVQAFITEWVKRGEAAKKAELPKPVDPWADVNPR